MERMLDPRRMIQDQVIKMFGNSSGTRGVDLDTPAGDPGLFGPESVSWRVHADFTTMMVGGVASLLMQMLHPLALAGVWDHSNFREDMTGRLRRTAQFIAGTTFGGRAEAERLIARVRAIHARVTGALPDGTPYAADDPALLTWIHAAEVSCFLSAYQRYRGALPRDEQDRYLRETATVARALGADDVPEDMGAMAAYFAGMRPALRFDARTAEVTRALRSAPASGRINAAFGALVMEAAGELLPDWAARLHGLPRPNLRAPAIHAGVRGMGSTLRWALTDGSAARARRRVAAAS